LIWKVYYRELNSNPNLICAFYMDNKKEVDDGTVYSIALYEKFFSPDV
jgi:hypothetical protein